jgi:hypothetical protein
MYKLSIQSDKGPLEVSWTDVDQLAKYANIQNGHYLIPGCDFSFELLNEKFQEWNQTLWNMEHEVGMHIYQDNSVFLDIGSGIGTRDMLLYSYVPGSKFYLVDLEGWDNEFALAEPPTVCYSNNYPIYNSWAPTKDAILTSNFDNRRFVLQSPDDTFPEADVVFSQFSWCFHYPKEVYWNRVMSCLKKGGLLQLDVRILQDRDIVGEISEELKSTPIERKYPMLPSYTDNYPVADPEHGWSRCVWTKNV